MTIETEVSEILRLMKAERADTAEIKQTLDLVLKAIEAGNATLQEILAACQGDGSGELVAQLRALTEAIQNLTVRVDAVADEVGA